MPRRGPVPGHWSAALLVALLLAAPGAAVRADVHPRTMNGVPLLPVPTFEEVGLPEFTMPTGTASTGTGDVGGGMVSGGSTSSSALDAMLSRDWGTAAQANAEALGVDATVVAGTGLIESNFRNVPAPGNGNTVSGVYQMTDDTYTTAINAAARENPGLAGRIDTTLSGKMDPANQSFAAAQELKTLATKLQAAGIESPTLADVRGGYHWGAGNAVALARAGDDQTMRSVLVGTSAATMAANGVSATTTVGEWRQSVAAKLGDSAGRPVLLNRS